MKNRVLTHTITNGRTTAQLGTVDPVAWLQYMLHSRQKNAKPGIALKQDQTYSVGIGSWAAPKNWTELEPDPVGATRQPHGYGTYSPCDLSMGLQTQDEAAAVGADKQGSAVAASARYCPHSFTSSSQAADNIH